jgi:hypothetical protein
MSCKRKHSSTSNESSSSSGAISKQLSLAPTEEESDEDAMLCRTKEDCRVGTPHRLDPLKYPYLYSDIIDEAVILMKDAKDQAAYSGMFKGNVTSDTLGKIIYKTEAKYGLPLGSIKESTVHSRLKSYRKPSKSGFSLLNSIDPPLIRRCIRAVKSCPHLKAEDVLHCLAVIKMAKVIIKEKERSLHSEVRFNYNRAKDWMKLDWGWVYEFKRRAFDAFQKEGIHLYPREKQGAETADEAIPSASVSG